MPNKLINIPSNFGIGDDVSDATANGVLYADSNGVLSQSTGFTYNGTLLSPGKITLDGIGCLLVGSEVFLYQSVACIAALNDGMTIPLVIERGATDTLNFMRCVNADSGDIQMAINYDGSIDLSTIYNNWGNIPIMHTSSSSGTPGDPVNAVGYLLVNDFGLGYCYIPLYN